MSVGKRPQTAPPRWQMIAAFASIYLIWGSTYVGIRFAIETIPVFLMASTRFFVAGALLLLWQWRRGEPAPTRLYWRSAAIVGLLMILGGNGGVTWSEQHVSSGFAALIIGATPIYVVLLDWLVFGAPRPTRRMTLGLLIGLVGLALLVGPWEMSGEESVAPAGVGALLLAGLCWTLGSLYSRRAPLPPAPMQATGMEMLCGGTALLVVGTLAGQWGELDLGAVSARSLLALTYLTFAGTLVGFSSFIWLLHHTTPARATSYAYVNPVVAVLLGWLLADEPLTLRTMVAAAVIIGSVVLVTSVRAQSDPPRASSPAPVREPLPAESTD